MRFQTAMLTGALALVPVLALAAEPMLVKIDGKTVAAHETSRVIQTAAGPAHVKTWSWHSPDGQSSFVMQSSTGGTPPAAMLYQMQAQMAQMQVMQAQMQALQQAAFAGMPGFGPAPRDALFMGPPVSAMRAPQPVLYRVLIAPPAQARPPVQAPASAAPAARSPGVNI